MNSLHPKFTNIETKCTLIHLFIIETNIYFCYYIEIEIKNYV